MRLFFAKSLICSSLLVCASIVAAQAAPRYPARYDERANLRDFQESQTLFHQVRSDLERAEHGSISPFGDRDSFERALSQLGELERQWEENDYTPRQAVYVIDAVQTVLNDNHLLMGDRDRLTEDIRKLRDFLASHQ